MSGAGRDDPKAGFRAISGLVIALFVGSGSIGAITTIVANNSGRTSGSSSANHALVQLFDQREGGAAPLASGTRAELTAIDGVAGVAELRIDPATVADGGPGQVPALLVACAELATIEGFGRCAPGAGVAEISPVWGGGVIDRPASMDATVWPASARSTDDIAAFSLGALLVGTDGSEHAVEAARTVLTVDPLVDHRGVPAFAPQTLSELNAHNTRDLQNYRQLANVVVLASLPIAGCSLAVSIAAGLSDRKRPFSLLRLAGSPLRMLRNVVMLESALPLLLGAVSAIGCGLLCASLFLQAQAGYSLVAPSASFYAITVTGIAAALGVIASTLPLLRRLTGPEAARND